ncbi:hypothetical protein [Mucilaginibacter sp.]|jgi:hypothetical protein|uniref:hypothetical protein n=1 Tax=Mucilaginibacter sp. TaxID=1882438 RepID=UPI002C82EB74|nr:hypothetical protein [Mucilaginibacter sp.]HTI59249.1 hypothetical protein [Mucilaginibacter sp.]
MDKNIILLMLESIKATGFVGPKEGRFTIGERVDFALGKGLIVRSDDGNFELTDKGAELLDGVINWEDL